MKRPIATLLFLFLITGFCQAQAPADTARKSEFYVSSNVIPIFGTIFYSYPNYQSYDLFLFKESIRRAGLAGYRWRVGSRAGGQYQERDELDYPYDGKKIDQDYQVSIITAMEKLWQPLPKIKTGLGPVAALNYQYDFEKSNSVDRSPYYEFIRKSNQYGVSIGVLGSVYWQPSSWFMLGGESQFLLTGSQSTIKISGSNYDEDRKLKGKYLNFNFSPLYRISACIRIK